MKQRTLGFGLLSLSIYLLGIYALSLAFLYLKSKPPLGFSIRLAFLNTEFDVLLGVQLLISLYFICSLACFFKPTRKIESLITKIGFWALSASTFLFGIKYLILVLAFSMASQSNMLGFLYQEDWMYYVFEWMMDLLFYIAMILFLIRLIIKVKKKYSSG
ncbi:hypothetical protein [Hazenella coriacea]|uniref:Uncharacterized protein n=1 Tax=Hazenella coriacea TaxID=1179467 RepID=A0A4R3LEB1_9BACL|nr:hypothetical protein [Hazenella coriacea]TCS95786.1 hypothetical protein EDD58_102367 [Hazenella coriacea]